MLDVHVIPSVAVLGFLVAVNCTVSPVFNVFDVGLTVKLVIAVVTVTVQLALFPFCVVAVIVVVPFAFAVTFPLWSTVATPVLLLFHVIPVFLFALLGCIVAFNFVVFVPLISNATLFLSNVIPVGLCTTVTFAFVFTNPLELFIVIVTVPCAIPVITPSSFTLATLLLLLDHTNPSVDPIDGFFVAVNVTVLPTSTSVSFGLTVIPIIFVSTVTIHSALYPFPVLTVIFAFPFDTPVTLAVYFPVFSTFALAESLLHCKSSYIFAVFGVNVAVKSTVFVPLKSTVALLLSNVTPVGLVTTVTLHVAVLLFSVLTVIVAVPFFNAVTRPVFSSTSATVLSLLVYFKCVYTFAVLGLIVPTN